jgi:4-carboxymuconolactone decarboxylase
MADGRSESPETVVSGEPRLRRLRPDEMTDEQRRIYDGIVSGPHRGRGGLVDGEGRLGGPLNTYLHAPTAGSAQAAFGAALSYELSLARRVAELVILMVVHEAGAEFAIAAHEWAGYQAGFTLEQLDALRERRQPALEDPGERIAWLTTSRLLQTRDLDDVEYDEAVSVLGERGVVELTMLIGYYQLLARQLRVFRVTGDAYTGQRVPARS